MKLVEVESNHSISWRLLTSGKQKTTMSDGGSCFRSTLNRFLTPDTIVPNPANPQSFNRFSYVLNQPLNYSDPSGHSECYAIALASVYETSWCKYWLQSTWRLDILSNNSPNYLAAQNAYDRDIWIAVGSVMENLPPGFNTSLIDSIGGSNGLARMVKRMIGRESQFINSTGPNAAGAVGLMQIIPGEIIPELIGFNIIPPGPYSSGNLNSGFNITNPQTNIYLGTSYLVRRALVHVGSQEANNGWDTTSGIERWQFALAVYNAGPSTVEVARLQCAAAGNCNPSIWNDVSTYLSQETQNYVADVLGPWYQTPALLEINQAGLNILSERGLTAQ